MRIHDLSTPCLMVDKARLEHNLARMQERADRNDVALRPHTKTHKSIDIARRQIDGGARGITVAKVGEAEVFIAAGFEDVRIAYPLVGDDKYRRLLPLLDSARISYCVDTAEAAEAASSFFSGHGREIEVLLKVDCGYRRAGVDWSSTDSLELAQWIAGLPGLVLRGILTHAGQSYGGPRALQDGSLESKEATLRYYAGIERDRMLEFAGRLDDSIDLSSFEISVGSTPTASVFENREEGGLKVTEIRPGNYVFFDRTQISIGSAKLDDCALSALFTVTSRQREDDGWRLILDGGRKILTSDPCGGGAAAVPGEYGLVLRSLSEQSQHPAATLYSLSEEHALVRLQAASSSADTHEPAVGDRVRVIPNHACVAVNTQDRYYLVDGEEVLQQLDVHTRGRVT